MAAVEDDIDEGFFSNLGRGGLLGAGDLERQRQILSELLAGRQPIPRKVESSPELGFDRKSLGQFIGRAGVGSVPGILGASGGAMAGGAAGSIIPGPGTIIGGLGGAAAGSGAMVAAQTFADAYNEARLAGQTHDQAIEYAGTAAKITGGVTGLATMLGGVGLKDVFAKQVAKQIPIQVATGQAENVARNVLAKKAGVDPERELFQGAKEAAVGPAIFQTAQSALTRPILNKPAKTPKASKATPKPVKPIAPKEVAAIAESVSKPVDTSPTTKIQQKIFETGETPKLATTLTEKAKDFARRNLSQTGLFDRFTPLKELGKKATGATRESENIPYRMARFSDHMTGVLEAAFEHGTPMWDANEKVVRLAPDSQGLSKILEPVLTTPEKLKEFETYAYARRVLGEDLIPHGKEKNISIQEARTALELGETNPEFAQVFDNYQKYNNSVLDIMEQTGLINENTRNIWQDMDYVPFYRELPGMAAGETKGTRPSKSSLAGQKPNIKELTGGKERYGVFDQDQNLVYRTFNEAEARARANQIGGEVETVGAPTKNIIENLYKNTADILPRAIRNAAAVENINLALEGGLVEPVNKKQARNRSGNLNDNVVSAYIDGKQQFFKVNDPLLYSALSSTLHGPNKLGGVVKGMNLAKNLFSRGVLLDPSVALGIAGKDLILSKMMGKDPMPGFIDTVKNITKGVGHEFGKPDPRAVEMMAMGGDTTFHRVSPEKVVERVTKDIGPQKAQILGSDYIKSPKKVMDLIDKFTRGLELGNRLNKYDAAKKAGRTNPEAVFEALDYMDYQMRGSGDLIPFLTSTVPFMASHLQGLHKLGREVAHNKFNNRTNKMIGTVASFALGNAFVNSTPDVDEEDAANGYKAQPDYIKNSSIMIDLHKYLGKETVKKGDLPRWLLIPKPWEIGFLSMTLPEHFVEGMQGDKTLGKEAQEIASIFMNQLSINPLGNPLVKTGIEQWADKQFFTGGTIVPRNREGVEPRLQYGPNTTEAAKAIGDLTNISPARLEHGIRGLFGLIGMYPLMAADLLSGKQGPTKEMPDKYLFNKYTKGDIAQRTAFENEMYELWKASEEAYRTYNVYLKKIKDPEKAEAYAESKTVELDRRKEINKIKKEVKEISDEILEISQDPEIEPAEKRRQINDLIKEKNLILKEMHDEYVKKQ